ncbi:MAG: methionine synthase, partial [Thermoprotei archaeon]
MTSLWDKFFDRFVSSHVGSIPLDYSLENVKKSFTDMVNVGIDVIPAPQLRDFISMYLEPLVERGILNRVHGGYAVSSDLDEVRKVTPSVPEFRVVASLAREKHVKWLRAPITGALTLASRIYMGDPSRGIRSTVLMERELVVECLSQYVSNIVRNAIEQGFNVVVIDEPMLSNIVGRRVLLYGYSEEEILEIYSRELKLARGLLRGTHVCGRISERLASLLAESEELEFMNHEFHDTPQNLELPWRRILEEGDKFLSPGVFSSRRAEVESVKEVASH